MLHNLLEQLVVFQILQSQVGNWNTPDPGAAVKGCFDDICCCGLHHCSTQSAVQAVCNPFQLVCCGCVGDLCVITQVANGLLGK